MQKIIDPHVHFFDLTKGKYAWLDPNNPPFWPDKHVISRNVMPCQLDLQNRFELLGAVHIEAGFDNEKPHNEVEWLERDVYTIAPKLAFKSIAHTDIKKPYLDFIEQIEKLQNSPTFAGVRYIIEEHELLINDCRHTLENLKFLENAGILLEVQLRIGDNLQTSSLLTLFKNVPQLKTIINHAGMPPGLTSSSNGKVTPLHKKAHKTPNDEASCWKEKLAQFARLSNCFVKCSGFEMQTRDYSKEDVIEVISQVHKCFGTERIMLASNFPLTLFSKSYTAYWQLLYDSSKGAKVSCDRVMYLNAKNLYSF